MYLKEIQGLRTVAALMVAVYHIWFHRVSGGVDAFFVISGFFLYRALFATGLPVWHATFSYWQRTVARIVPGAGAVVLATCGLFFWLDVDSLWSAQLRSGLASLFFVENWRLWLTGTDYLAEGQLPSPFQQMWALSLQMQIYLGLPVLLVVLASLARRLAGSRVAEAKVLAAALLLVTGVSFAYALAATRIDQPRAYFDSGARLWEFSSGALLAAFLPRMVLPPVAAGFLGYACLAVLLGFAAFIPVAKSFPGAAALVPALATAGIVTAAANRAEMALLNNRTMQYLGDISFTFYLWHWPLLIAWRLSRNSDEVSLPAGAAIIASAGLLAWLTLVLAERPFRSSAIAKGRPVFALLAIVLVVAPAFSSVGAWGLAYVARKTEATAALSEFLQSGTASGMVPGTTIAKADVPAAYRKGCHQRVDRNELIECVFGDPQASAVVVLVGGSHSLQWLPALQELSQDGLKMRIISMSKSSCPLTLSGEDLALPDEASCLEWNRRAIARTFELQPDVIVTLLTTTREQNGGTELIPAGFRAAWAALPPVPVLAVRDNPRPDFDVPVCVDILGPDAPECAFDRTATLLAGPLATGGLPSNLHPLDLTAELCAGSLCPPVRNGVLVWRDKTHVTATYARLLAPHFRRALDEISRLAAKEPQ